MSIETLLTILVAAGILVTAAALWLLARGLLRVVRRDAIEAALPRAAFAERARRALGSSRAAALYLMAEAYSALRKMVRAGHTLSLRADVVVMAWWHESGLPFVRESAAATHDLATFYRGRPEEIPYLARTSLVPNHDPTRRT